MTRNLIAFLAILLVLPALASESEQKNPVNISFVEDSTDAVAGKTVLGEAYRRLGREIQFQAMSGADALQASSSGEVDAELQRVDGITRTFPDLIQVPIPVNYLQGVAFSIKYDFPATGWRSLQPYRIGIVKGIIFSKEGTDGMNVTIAQDYVHLFELLRQNKIDVAVTPRINGLARLNRRVANADGQDASVREMSGVLETLFLYHYVHKSHAGLVPDLTDVLTQMLRDGTTRKLRDQAYARVLSE